MIPNNIVVYTVAFAFCGDDVLLIRKDKPDWQKGLLNGIGGKMEATDSSVHAATVREFREETGLLGYGDNAFIYHALAWHEYHDHKRPVVYFSAFEIDKAGMHEAVDNTINNREPCIIWKWKKVINGICPCMPNLPFLIEMARCLVYAPTTDEAKLRQPVVLTPEVYSANFQRPVR